MEVDILKQIAKNTAHKTSFQIIVSDNKTNFNIRLNPTLQLDRDKHGWKFSGICRIFRLFSAGKDHFSESQKFVEKILWGGWGRGGKGSWQSFPRRNKFHRSRKPETTLLSRALANYVQYNPDNCRYCVHVWSFDPDWGHLP